jgi:general secretion pathway protein C
MEAFFKKYFWCVNFIFIALAAWLVAGAVQVIIVRKVRALPSVPAAAGPRAQLARPLPEQKDNSIVVQKNYFGSAMALPVETIETGPEIDEKAAEELLGGSLSNLNASLVGTMVASDKAWSMAIITDKSASETGIYRVDDTLMGEARVVDILPQRVYILRGGVREYLELQEKASPKAPAGNRPPIASAPPAAGGIGEGIKKTGENAYSIQRGEIDKVLSNLNNIAMQARIVPSFVNGEANGFKLFAIRPDSLYSKIGIENGDIIQKINGFPMNSPDKALEIYQKLKSASSVDVEIVRNGKTMKLNYQIQ